MFTSKIKCLASAAVLSFAASASYGATVNLTADDQGSFGSLGWYEGVNRTITDNPNGGAEKTSNLLAGMFSLHDGIDAILAFCLEPGIFLDLSVSFDTAAAPNIASDKLAVVEQLFNTAFDAVVDASSAAAFQLAIWEIAVEGVGSDYDLSDGNHFINSWDGGTLETGQAFLDGLDGPATGSYLFTTYTNSGQDLISAEIAPVPLPAGGLMMLSGLGAFAAVRRKTSKK